MSSGPYFQLTDECTPRRSWENERARQKGLGNRRGRVRRLQPSGGILDRTIRNLNYAERIARMVSPCIVDVRNPLDAVAVRTLDCLHGGVPTP